MMVKACMHGHVESMKSNFCGKCGVPVTLVESQTIKKCPECGQLYTDLHDYCEDCGVKLEELF